MPLSGNCLYKSFKIVVLQTQTFRHAFLDLSGSTTALISFHILLKKTQKCDKTPLHHAVCWPRDLESSCSYVTYVETSSTARLAIPTRTERLHCWVCCHKSHTDSQKTSYEGFQAVRFRVGLTLRPCSWDEGANGQNKSGKILSCYGNFQNLLWILMYHVMCNTDENRVN